MRRMVSRWIGLGVFVASLAAGVVTAPAASAVPSCAGQAFSELATELGSGLGEAVAFEARNPGLEGRKSFGVEVREIANAEPSACPGEE